MKYKYLVMSVLLHFSRIVALILVVLTFSARADGPENKGVVLYEHSGFVGESRYLWLNSSDANYKRLYFSGTWTGKNWNDKVSSFKVKRGVEVHFYVHADFGGAVLVYKGPIAVSSMPSGWNDAISSSVVKTVGTISPEWP